MTPQTDSSLLTHLVPSVSCSVLGCQTSSSNTVGCELGGKSDHDHLHHEKARTSGSKWASLHLSEESCAEVKAFDTAWTEMVLRGWQSAGDKSLCDYSRKLCVPLFLSRRRECDNRSKSPIRLKISQGRKAQDQEAAWSFYTISTIGVCNLFECEFLMKKAWRVWKL